MFKCALKVVQFYMCFSQEAMKVGKHLKLKLRESGGQQVQTLLHKEYGCGTNLL